MANVLAFEHDYSEDVNKSDAVRIPVGASYIGLCVPSKVDGNVTLEIFARPKMVDDDGADLRKVSDGLGSELVTNGAFSTNQTGWTAEASTLSSEATGQAGKGLVVTNSGAARGYAKQQLTVVSGRYYYGSYYHQDGQAQTADQQAFNIGTTAKGTDYYASGNFTDAAWTIGYVTGFRATGTAAHISCGPVDADAADDANFDTITIKEISPLDPKQDADWFPVIDQADGQDAVINASTYDPGVTDITQWVAAFGGMYMRCVSAGTQTADLTYYLTYV